MIALWEHLAGRLIPKSGDKFQTQAALLTELGWRHGDGRAVTESALRHLPVYEVLTNLTDQPVTWRRRNAISPAAATLARKAIGG